MKQYITLLLAAVGILTLAGCVQEDYETVFVTPSDSESVEEVPEDEGRDLEEAEASEETSEEVDPTSSEDTRDKDASIEEKVVERSDTGGTRLSIEELGISLELPAEFGNLDVSKITCDEGNGCDQDGSLVTAVDEQGRMILGAASVGWSPARSAQLVEVRHVDSCEQGSTDDCFPGQGNLLDSGDVEGLEYLLYEASQSLDGTPGDFDNYLAVIRLNGDQYKALGLSYAKVDIGLEVFMDTIESIRLES